MSHVHHDPIPEGALTLMGLIIVAALAVTTGARVFAVPPAAQPATLRAADGGADRKSTRLNSSHSGESRMPSSA